ncbi:hypothetical protein ANCCEY_04704 [Ancylostoma ceylanicum]|uniref:Uncharacterized protein n=1 Tax=Ancylostoma ceylanicum TaxID=53326 RepID=A0A0D6M1J0_9BILA|nr:hypothetical protein ANCCEY_04704 [Ancylostoma ceylanicum]
MEASRLRDYLKAKESDANKPWNKPGWPGPKKSDDESLRELEHIKKSIETLQKKIRAHSMQDLRTLRTPEEFARETRYVPFLRLINLPHVFLLFADSTTGDQITDYSQDGPNRSTPRHDAAADATPPAAAKGVKRQLHEDPREDRSTCCRFNANRHKRQAQHLRFASSTH